MRRQIVLAVAAVAGVMVAFAADYTWDGGAGTPFLNGAENAANWSGDVVPTSSDTAKITFSEGVPTYLSLVENWSVKNLTFANSLRPAVTVDLKDKKLDVSGGKILIDGVPLTFKDGVLAFNTFQPCKATTGPFIDLTFTNVQAVVRQNSNSVWSEMHRATQGGIIRTIDSVVTNLPLSTANCTNLCIRSVVSGWQPNSQGGSGWAWILSDHSTATNVTANLGSRCGRIVVENGSVFHAWGGPGNQYGGLTIGAKDSAAHDNYITMSNSTLHVSARMTVAGTNDTVVLHNTSIVGGTEFALTGVSNKFVVTTSPGQAVSSAIKFTLGRETSYEIGKGTTYTNRDAMAVYQARGVTISAEEDSLWRVSKITTKNNNDVLRNSTMTVEKGATVSLDLFSGSDGFNGYTNAIVCKGSVLIDKTAELGKYSPADALTLELVGDDAEFIAGVNIGGSTGHLILGNAALKDVLTIKFRPGPSGFGGVAPLRTILDTNVYGTYLYDAILDVDASDCVKAVAARHEAYRIPLVHGGSFLTISDLAAIKAKSRLVPSDGQLVQDGNTLYFEFHKKPGLMILVR